MYYSYVEIEYVAMSFSPARTDLALKLLKPLHSNGHQKCKKTFEEMKALMAAEVLCAYPDHN
jgi:hypothetical protein